MIFPWHKSSTGIIGMSNLSAWPHTAGKWLFLSRRLCGIKAWKGVFDNASTPSYVSETENIREREAPGSAESIPFSMSLCHLQLHHRAWANVLCISVCVCVSACGRGRLSAVCVSASAWAFSTGLSSICFSVSGWPRDRCGWPAFSKTGMSETFGCVLWCVFVSCAGRSSRVMNKWSDREDKRARGGETLPLSRWKKKTDFWKDVDEWWLRCRERFADWSFSSANGED